MQINEGEEELVDMAEPNEGAHNNDSSDASSLGNGQGSHAAKAEAAVYQKPSPARAFGGRIILAFQHLTEKLLGGRPAQVHQQVIDQDRELSELTHDLGELTTQIVQINRKLESLEQRLDRLEDRDSRLEQAGS